MFIVFIIILLLIVTSIILYKVKQWWDNKESIDIQFSITSTGDRNYPYSMCATYDKYSKKRYFKSIESAHDYASTLARELIQIVKKETNTSKLDTEFVLSKKL